MKRYYQIILAFVLISLSGQVLAQCSLQVFPDSASICSGDSVQLIALDLGGSEQFIWSPAAGLSSSTGSAVYAKPGTTTTYNISEQGCTAVGDTAHITVTVYNFPVVNPVSNATYCNDTEVNEINFTSPDPGTTFSWYSKNSLNIGFGINGFGSIPAFNTFNPDSLPVFDTIIVNATANGCTGPASSFIITVNPTPHVTEVPGTLTFCHKENIETIVFISSTPNVVFNWQSDHNIGFGTSGTGNISGNKYKNNTTDSITATITVSASLGNCQGPDTSFTITVYPLPQFTGDTLVSVCDDSVFNYNATATPGTNFSWKREVVPGISNALGSDTTNSITEILDNTTDLPITVKYVFTLTPAFNTARKKCKSTDTLYVIVNPTPKVNFISDTIYCTGESVTGIPFGSQSPNAAFNWTSNNNVGFGIEGSGNIPGFLASNLSDTTIVATVSVYAIANGCQGPASSFTVTIVPGPALTSSKVGALCDSDTFVYGASSSVNNTGFSWTRNADIFGNDSSFATNNLINEVLKNTTDTTITVNYNFELEAGGGCIGYDTVKVTVYPTPKLNSALKDTTCDNVPFSYLATTATPGTTFSWSRDTMPGISNAPDSVASNSINEILDNTTSDTVSVIYKFTLTANGCTNQQDVLVTINPTPVLNNTVLYDTICNDEIFVDTVSSNIPGTTFYWERDTVAGITPLTNSDATDIIIDSLHNSTSVPIDVPYSITLTEPSGCPHTEIIIVTVYPSPELSTGIVATACDSMPFVYQALSSTPGVTFGWNRAVVNGINNPAGSDTTGLINEVLYNITDTSVMVVYQFTLTTADYPCSNSQFLNVKVNPTLRLSSATDTSICSDVPFSYTASSFTDSVSFSWSRDSVNGISNNSAFADTGFISETLTNFTDTPVVVTYKFTLTTADSVCSNFQFLLLTVNPTPKIDSVSDKVYCDGDSIGGIQFSSQSPGAVFSWTLPQNIDIGFGTSGSGNIPAFVATNTDTAPKTIQVIVSIKASADSCPGPDRSFFITVNPIPTLTSVTDTSICSGNSLNYLITSNFINGVLYSWTSSAIPVVSGNTNQVSSVNNTIPDTLINSLNDVIIPVTYDLTLTFTNAGKNCKSDTSLTVNVNPSPRLPLFSSLLPNAETITLCGGSENINFNVISPDTVNGTTYQWLTNETSKVDIRNTTNPNTVITFDSAGTFEIKVIAFNNSSLGGCPDSASQIVIISSGDSIIERKIILKQPGNLLVYPDNSMALDSGYQWGYDLRITDTILGPPHNIPNQVYQVFIPESKYLTSSGTQLDTFKYCFWVLLKKGTCRSKVYYNGPYAQKRLGDDLTSDQTVGVNVFPNPTLGSFYISLYGKIYGDIDAKIYSTLGQAIYQTTFLKKSYETTQRIEGLNLPNGIYLLELLSSDHQKITTRIVIAN